jgi:hypothetical protein
VKKLVLCLFSIGLALSVLMSGLVVTPVQAAGVSTQWAILISGGYNRANNNARYWNDISEMYEILTDTFGYSANNIFVLYADGNPPTTANCCDPQNAYGYPTYTIDYAATLNNLDTVTDTIAAGIDSDDTLFVFTNDHGATDGSLYLWGETISPATFAGSGYIGKITQYSWRAFEMKQCYSGAFVPPLSGPRTAIATSCRADEPAYGGVAPHDRYGEFSFHFNAALKEAEPDFVGGAPVDADVNNDGNISFVEAFNYAQSHDGRPEHPQYDDNGDGISHEGQMPVGGDGSLGTGVFVGRGFFTKIVPNAVGAVTQLERYPEVANYLDVDDPPGSPDDFATFVAQGGDFGESWSAYDLYNLQNPTGSGTINYIVVHYRCEKIVLKVAVVYAQSKIKTGGTEYTGAQHPLTRSWSDYTQQYNTNPKTGVAWTWTDLNSLQAGVRMSSNPGYTDWSVGYCTQVYVEVNYTP